MLVFMPYMYACAKYRGYIWKGLTFYLFLNCMNAIYDCGMYTRFFVYGPSSMKKCAELDPNKSFASI